MTLMYCSRLHVWWSTKSQLASLLSSLIARRCVELQTVWRFRLKDLSIDEMVGAWCFGCCQANRINLLDFFCSGIQFYLLLSPYLCFISFLFLDLYVLGDDALISWGPFMQTEHLCVLTQIWTKGEVGAPLNRLKPSSKILYWSFQGGASFVDHLCYFCLVLLCFHARLFVDALWSPAGKGPTSWLSFVMSNCDVGQVWCLIVSVPDLCPLSYF